MADVHEAAGARLRAIADRLGVPVERFFEEAPPDGAADPSAADLGELLRLWRALGSAARRAEALAYIRDLAGEGAG